MKQSKRMPVNHFIKRRCLTRLRRSHDCVNFIMETLSQERAHCIESEVSDLLLLHGIVLSLQKAFPLALENYSS